MKNTVTCSQCGAICEYDDHSVWEGNREHEDFLCPKCGNVIGSAFTDLIPIVTVIKKGEKETKNEIIG
ncbi:MAG: hypothetical protein IJ661_07760 [Lachnospiraceae bacterium]|nr:hypothetical protein [Lachnospiraceae bacterium]